MKVKGLIAEFNPFHNGHLHIINQMKQEPDSAIVCVMSGNFMQRGEAALISKFARAKAAVLNGCDLVIELPAPYSLSSAMHFAGGGVDLLNALGVVDELWFGSESANIGNLKNIAAILQTELFEKQLKNQLSLGLGFAAARQKAVETAFPELDATALENPNDILGIEYCAAISRLNSKIEPHCVQRIGAAHDAAETADNIAGAKTIREKIAAGASFERFMPKASLDILLEEAGKGKIANQKRLETAIVAHLRTTPAAEFLKVPDVSEGLQNKISISANKYATLDEILNAVTSKRYPLSRIRRIVLCSYLGITYGMQRRSVPYCRVLAMNEKGADILSAAHKTAQIPLIGSLKEAEKLGDYAAELVILESRCTDIFSLMMKNPPCGKIDYTTKLYKTF